MCPLNETFALPGTPSADVTGDLYEEMRHGAIYIETSHNEGSDKETHVRSNCRILFMAHVFDMMFSFN